MVKKKIRTVSPERIKPLCPIYSECEDTIGMDNPWQYRNKAQLQVGKVGEQVIAGLYEQGSHHLIDLSVE